MGGTIGDIEGMPFIEAFRQFQFKVGLQNFCNIHVSLVPQVTRDREGERERQREGERERDKRREGEIDKGRESKRERQREGGRVRERQGGRERQREGGRESIVYCVFDKGSLV